MTLAKKHMLIINWVGLAICAIGFGVSFAVGHFLFHSTSEGLIMVIAGPIVCALDVLYRMKSQPGQWSLSQGGGCLFWVPVWAFGVVWLVLGIFYLMGGRA